MACLVSLRIRQYSVGSFSAVLTKGPFPSSNRESTRISSPAMISRLSGLSTCSRRHLRWPPEAGKPTNYRDVVHDARLPILGGGNVSPSLTGDVQISTRMRKWEGVKGFPKLPSPIPIIQHMGPDRGDPDCRVEPLFFPVGPLGRPLGGVACSGARRSQLGLGKRSGLFEEETTTNKQSFQGMK